MKNSIVIQWQSYLYYSSFRLKHGITEHATKSCLNKKKKKNKIWNGKINMIYLKLKYDITDMMIIPSCKRHKKSQL